MNVYPIHPRVLEYEPDEPVGISAACLVNALGASVCFFWLPLIVWLLS